MRVRVSLLLLVAGWGASLFGATLERLSLNDMTNRSTAIVRARAVSSSPVLIGSTIYTKTRFQVLERWKGPEGATVDVTEPGGASGQMSQNFPGVPRFSPGQELLLFLWTGPSGRTQVIGLSQGVFEVTRSAATGEVEVSRQPSGERMVAPGTGAPVEEEAITMPLPKMVWRIQQAMERNRQR